jgi:hypothetical protein
MRRTGRNLVLAICFVIGAAVISIPLGIKSEGIALQLGFDHGTPGLFVADKVAGDEPLGEARMRRELFIALFVDGPLWFFAICGTAVAVVLYRRKRNQSHEV